MPPGKAATAVAAMAVAMASATAVAIAEGVVVAAGIECMALSHIVTRLHDPSLCFFFFFGFIVFFDSFVFLTKKSLVPQHFYWDMYKKVEFFCV
jgi:hypothetical protein